MTGRQESAASECNCNKCDSNIVVLRNATSRSSPNRQKPPRPPTPFKPPSNKGRNCPLPKNSKTSVVLEPSFLIWIELCMTEMVQVAMKKRDPSDDELKTLCGMMPMIWTSHTLKAVSFYSHTSDILINSILDKMNSEIEVVLNINPNLINAIYGHHLSLLIKLIFHGVHKEIEFLRFCAVAIEVFMSCYAYPDFKFEFAIRLLAKLSCVMMEWQKRENVIEFLIWAEDFAQKLD